jgi:hypothetical protein
MVLIPVFVDSYPANRSKSYRILIMQSHSLAALGAIPAREDIFSTNPVIFLTLSELIVFQVLTP